MNIIIIIKIKRNKKRYFVKNAIINRDSNFEKIVCSLKQRYYNYILLQKYDFENCEPNQLSEKIKDEELDKLVQEYYALDFEDVISGGTKLF